ncbi:MAG: hypothetical protein VKK62_02840 [Synechococcaceae cyanobacterium]|nr:hypothetical protein [Synechococcaceae cyanobacterium]
MLWLRRWNFIERARLERELWEAFERGEDLDALVETCRGAASAGDSAAVLRLEVWQTTVVRIRRIERMMQGQPQPGGERTGPGPGGSSPG